MGAPVGKAKSGGRGGVATAVVVALPVGFGSRSGAGWSSSEGGALSVRSVEDWEVSFSSGSEAWPSGFIMSGSGVLTLGGLGPTRRN